jgi:SAM-dependent methyltransferase
LPLWSLKRNNAIPNITIQKKVMTKYIHYDFTHNRQSPSEIVGIINTTLNPASVVDVGCGTGNFLYQFKKSGVKKVLGIDGSWVDKKVLAENLGTDEFREMDLEKAIEINEKFDLALCLEVAEHIDEKGADRLIQSLVNLSDVIVFSAAIPFQGGQNHINEQWTGYWVEKFKTHGYVSYDGLRPIFWSNDKIQWWYRQNIFIAYNSKISFDKTRFATLTPDNLNDYIHKDLYLNKSKELDDITKGRFTFGFYIKLLIKKIRRIIRK